MAITPPNALGTRVPKTVHDKCKLDQSAIRQPEIPDAAQKPSSDNFQKKTNNPCPEKSSKLSDFSLFIEKNTEIPPNLKGIIEKAAKNLTLLPNALAELNAHIEKLAQSTSFVITTDGVQLHSVPGTVINAMQQCQALDSAANQVLSAIYNDGDLSAACQKFEHVLADTKTMLHGLSSDSSDDAAKAILAHTMQNAIRTLENPTIAQKSGVQDQLSGAHATNPNLRLHHMTMLGKNTRFPENGTGYIAADTAIALYNAGQLSRSDLGTVNIHRSMTRTGEHEWDIPKNGIALKPNSRLAEAIIAAKMGINDRLNPEIILDTTSAQITSNFARILLAYSMLMREENLSPADYRKLTGQAITAMPKGIVTGFADIGTYLAKDVAFDGARAVINEVFTQMTGQMDRGKEIIAQRNVNEILSPMRMAQGLWNAGLIKSSDAIIDHMVDQWKNAGPSARWEMAGSAIFTAATLGAGAAMQAPKVSAYAGNLRALMASGALTRMQAVGKVSAQLARLGVVGLMEATGIGDAKLMIMTLKNGLHVMMQISKSLAGKGAKIVHAAVAKTLQKAILLRNDNLIRQANRIKGYALSKLGNLPIKVEMRELALLRPQLAGNHGHALPESIRIPVFMMASKTPPNRVPMRSRTSRSRSERQSGRLPRSLIPPRDPGYRTETPPQNRVLIPAPKTPPTRVQRTLVDAPDLGPAPSLHDTQSSSAPILDDRGDGNSPELRPGEPRFESPILQMYNRIDQVFNTIPLIENGRLNMDGITQMNGLFEARMGLRQRHIHGHAGANNRMDNRIAVAQGILHRLISSSLQDAQLVRNNGKTIAALVSHIDTLLSKLVLNYSADDLITDSRIIDLVAENIFNRTLNRRVSVEPRPRVSPPSIPKGPIRSRPSQYAREFEIPLLMRKILATGMLPSTHQHLTVKSLTIMGFPEATASELVRLAGTGRRVF